MKTPNLDICRQRRIPYQSQKRFCNYCGRLYIPKTYIPIKKNSLAKTQRLAKLNCMDWSSTLNGHILTPSEVKELLILTAWRKKQPKVISKRWCYCSDKCYIKDLKFAYLEKFTTEHKVWIG